MWSTRPGMLAQLAVHISPTGPCRNHRLCSISLTQNLPLGLWPCPMGTPGTILSVPAGPASQTAPAFPLASLLSRAKQVLIQGRVGALTLGFIPPRSKACPQLAHAPAYRSLSCFPSSCRVMGLEKADL